MSATPMTTDLKAHDTPTGPRPPDAEQSGSEKAASPVSGADLAAELAESRTTTRMAVLAVARLAYALGQEQAISDRLAELLAGANTEAGVDLEDIEAALVAPRAAVSPPKARRRRMAPPDRVAGAVRQRTVNRAGVTRRRGNPPSRSGTETVKGLVGSRGWLPGVFDRQHTHQGKHGKGVAR